MLIYTKHYLISENIKIYKENKYVFFKKLFGGKKEEDKKEIIAPVTNGELLEISEVPDEVFSSKMMGDGFSMKVTDGEKYFRQLMEKL